MDLKIKQLKQHLAQMQQMHPEISLNNYQSHGGSVYKSSSQTNLPEVKTALSGLKTDEEAHQLRNMRDSLVRSKGPTPGGLTENESKHRKKHLSVFAPASPSTAMKQPIIRSNKSANGDRFDSSFKGKVTQLDIDRMKR